jgi:hypothetical protein
MEISILFSKSFGGSMDFPSHWPRPKLWVIRLQKSLESIFPPALASVIPFALPLTIAGIIISYSTGERLFTRGVIFGLVWLAVAPYLITHAFFHTVAGFFDNNRDKFLSDDASIQKLQYEMVRSLESPKYLFLAIPFATLCVFVLLNTLYASSSSAVRVWAAATFGTLFFLSGVGFWGIARFNYVFKTVCQQNLIFDPYHADGFGGLSFLGQFNVKGPQYFFSGALIFPIVVEIVDTLPQNELIVLALWIAVGLFLGFGIAGFLIPQLEIKDIIAKNKYEKMKESEAVLQALLQELFTETGDNKELAELIHLKIDVYYEYYHQRILSVKEWPFDWKIIFQILSSLVMPAIILIIEVFLQ